MVIGGGFKCPCVGRWDDRAKKRPRPAEPHPPRPPPRANPNWAGRRSTRNAGRMPASESGGQNAPGSDASPIAKSYSRRQTAHHRSRCSTVPRRISRKNSFHLNRGRRAVAKTHRRASRHTRVARVMPNTPSLSVKGALGVLCRLTDRLTIPTLQHIETMLGRFGLRARCHRKTSSTRGERFERLPVRPTYS